MRKAGRPWSGENRRGIRRACEESRKAAGQEETTKGWGEPVSKAGRPWSGGTTKRLGEPVRKAGRPLVERKPQRDEESL